MEQARALVEDIRTILIVDAQQDDLVAAGQSSADAVLDEADCFTEDKPVIALLLGTFDSPNRRELRPTYDSFRTGRPRWWHVSVEP